MRYFLLLAVLCISTISFSQRRRSGGISTKNDFIGTWTLTKLADKHLDYLPDKVEKKIVRFTDDSVFINAHNKAYTGTWKLVGAQPVISIANTKQFNYRWMMRNDDDIFFTVDGQHYEYFVRSKLYSERLKGEWILISDTNSHIVYTDKEEKAYYGKALMAKYTYEINGDTLTCVDQSNNEIYAWLILNLTEDKLNLKHIRTGHVLYMRKRKVSLVKK